MKGSAYWIKINGKTYSVSVTEVTNGGSAPVIAAPVVVDRKPAPVVARPVDVKNGTPVSAPMPGTVVSIKKNACAVRKGEAILVLEAMKMENEIASPCDGTVEVSVSVGAKVNSGDVLAVVK